MMIYTDLFASFDLLSPVTTHDESWGFLQFKGLYADNVLSSFIAINTALVSKGLSIKIDGESVSIEDIQLYTSNNTNFENWELHINKSAGDDNSENYFYKTEKLSEWLSNLSAFSSKNPFHNFKRFKIIVGDLDQFIQGKLFLILPLNNAQQDDFWEIETIPDKDSVNKYVQFNTNDDIFISPANFIYKSQSTSSIILHLQRLVTTSLAASVVSEFISSERISIDGVKKIHLKLWEPADDFNTSLYDELMSLVEWVYQEKTATRLKLFYDRITLEINENESYISGLSLHLGSALQQSKQRYNFIFLERKDKYVSELKDLLKDIRNQSDLYAQKIRSLLNNLLRDILAALVLVGFTLFTKLSDNIELDKTALIKYVFYALAIYYLASILLQIIIDVTDIEVSKKEMLYWKTTANELLPTNEVQTRIDDSLRGRRKSLRILYPIIATFYFIIVVVCFMFPAYFHKAIINTKVTPKQNNPFPISDTPTFKDKNLNDKIFKHPIKTDSSSSSREQGK